MTGIHPWALELLLAAFAGGAFGAAIGALPAFALTGGLVIVGEVHGMLVRGVASVGPAAGDASITATLAFGPVFGPHVSFGGGAAAAAYAARRGYLDTGFPYHEAKNILRGLGTKPDVLAVGGAFGVAGHLIATGSGAIAAPWDPVAAGVVGSALLHRAAFGYSLFGQPIAGWFDMTPFEAKQRRPGDAATDGGRLAVEPWLPHQYRWSDVSALGVAVGVLGAYVAYVTASPFLAFGISAATLALLAAGVESFPVTHHITLPASTAVLALVPGAVAGTTPAAVAAAVPLWAALAAGAGFGLLGAVAGEAAQRLLYAHADTHLDPPAASIVLTSLAIALLAAVGVTASAVWVPLP